MTFKEGCTVDVIIPVYKGKEETLKALDSVIESKKYNKTNFNIIVINDASEDRSLVSSIKTLQRLKKIVFIHNDKNLGFVKTVNKGMMLSKNDVILLNSDTEVFSNWVDRLISCAYRRDDIATVTPLSNNASICSYPKIINERNAKNNSINSWHSSFFDNLTKNEKKNIDIYAKKANSRLDIKVPTGIGFCIYIKRDAIKTIGYFDTVFEKGYCEEVDFCLKAEKNGLSNHLALDTFVYHKGGLSFSDSAIKIQEKNHKILRKKHNNFDSLITKFQLENPPSIFLRKIDLLRFYYSEKPLILITLHAHGGGTIKHAKDLSKTLSKSANVFWLKPNNMSQYELSKKDEIDDFCLYFNRSNLNYLTNFIKLMSFDKIHYQHIIGLENELLSLPDNTGISFDITLHDYFTVCPNIHLLNTNHSYCKEPFINENYSDNKNCLCRKQGINQKEWINSWENWLKNANNIYVPSIDFYKRIKKYFKGLNNIIPVQHPETYFKNDKVRETLEKNKEGKKSKVKNIILIGALSTFKGSSILKEVLLLAQKEDTPIQFHLFGNTTPKIKDQKKFKNYGSYNDKNLLNLIKTVPCDYIWLPFLWPETHSFTLTAAMLSKKPIISTNIGAIPERINNYEAPFLLCDIKTNAHEWLKTLENPIFDRKVKTDIKEKVKKQDFYLNEYLKNIKIRKKDLLTNKEEYELIRYADLSINKNTRKISKQNFKRYILILLITLKKAPILAPLSQKIPISIQVKVKNILFGQK